MSTSAEARIDVLGVGISHTNMPEAVGQVREWLEAGERAYVCVVPVAGVMAAQRDPRVHQAIEHAGLAVPDGMPIVWAGRYVHAERIGRVYGPDLMAAVCNEAAARGWKTYLYGGSPEIGPLLSESLTANFPGLEIVGFHSPPYRELTDDEIDHAAERINVSGAEIVWVGLSTPKQDLWMARVIDRLDGPVVLFGVGAAFDIHAGVIQRPPDWMGPLGLFWLYRLMQEPRRLWRRYLVDIPGFLAKVARRRPFMRDSPGTQARS